MKTNRPQLADLHARGFDASTYTFGWPNLISVACSQCRALVINGVACHETGCTNARHECRGCNELIPVRARYCGECR